MVGTGRFELPTPRTPSECSTRLSHVPTQGVFLSVHERSRSRATPLELLRALHIAYAGHAPQSLHEPIQMTNIFRVDNEFHRSIVVRTRL